MNDNVAIKLQGVSKKYTIGKEKDGSLRGTLGNLFSKKSTKTDEFWALKDVSFEVQKGDVVGIIGRNGAGKSTLLKILSQITRPTDGKIEINGRIASLLEVGTGFHPELTGRENVYLNGTILGMTRKEVQAKFDEIVAFSGIEKFIDTPVKHYSSGMYVRLAFAVAAHLEPEILIIDEVLAVGDAEFQKKCLGKMKDVAGEGRTVIFVSHDLAAVKSLCNKGVLLERGKVLNQGQIESTIKKYLDNFTNKGYESKDISISSVEMQDENKNKLDYLTTQSFCLIKIDVENRTNHELDFGFTIFNSEYVGLISGLISDSNKRIKQGVSNISIKIPTSLLHTGKYIMEGALFDDYTVYYQNDNIFSFEKIGDDILSLKGKKSKGLLRIDTEWEIIL